MVFEVVFPLLYLCGSRLKAAGFVITACLDDLFGEM
jgi:hypothetical protein